MPRHKFPKGNNLNPLGAGAHNKALKTVKRLTKAELAEVASMIVKNDVVELKEMAANAEHPDPKKRPSVIQLWYASIAIKGINKGDGTHLNPLLDRVIGKVKDEIELSGPDGTPIAISAMTKEEREAEIQKMIDFRNAVK